MQDHRPTELQNHAKRVPGRAKKKALPAKLNPCSVPPAPQSSMLGLLCADRGATAKAFFFALSNARLFPNIELGGVGGHQVARCANQLDRPFFSPDPESNTSSVFIEFVHSMVRRELSGLSSFFK